MYIRGESEGSPFLFYSVYTFILFGQIYGTFSSYILYLYKFEVKIKITKYDNNHVTCKIAGF